MSAAHVAENSGFQKRVRNGTRWRDISCVGGRWRGFPSIQHIASQRRLSAERLIAKPNAASNSKMTLVGSGRRDHCRRRIRRRIAGILREDMLSTQCRSDP